MSAMRLVIDARVYSVDAVKKAAYRLLGKFSPRISTDPSGILCELSFPPDASDVDKTEAASEFWKELLDQDLRERVGQETATARNAILAVAFAPVTERRE